MTATHVSTISRRIGIVRIHGCVQLHHELMESLKTSLAPDQAEKGGPTCRKAYLMTKKTLQVARDSQPVPYILSLLFHGHNITSTFSIKGYIYLIQKSASPTTYRSGFCMCASQAPGPNPRSLPNASSTTCMIASIFSSSHFFPTS